MPQSYPLSQFNFQCHNAIITVTLSQYLSHYINMYMPQMIHIPQHNHGLCQDNHYDLCQDHHTICPDNHHALYKKITKIYANIVKNYAPTSMTISPSSMPRDKHKNMYKLHTFSRQQDRPYSMRGMTIT